MSLPANISNMKAAIVQTAAQNPAQSGDLYLKFSKGDYSYGAEGNEPDPDSVFAVNPASLAMGFQAWPPEGHALAGKLQGEDIRVVGNPVLPADLPDVGVPWQEAIRFQLRCVEGEEKDLQFVFNSCSKGGVRAFKESILQPIAAKLAEDDSKCVPLIKLVVDSYKHSNKAIGKVYVPVFEIVGWAEFDSLADAEATAAETTEAPAAVVTEPEPEAAHEPEQASAPEPEAPRRRRRRAS